MKKKYLIILLLTMILLPFKIFAAGGFGVSITNITMYPGETKTINITSNNAVGKLNISSSNGGVATVNTGSVFIQNPGSSESITITAKSIGTATISVVASDQFATMDEEYLTGQTKTITVKVIAKPAPTQSTPTKPTQPSKPSNNNNNNNSNKQNNTSTTINNNLSTNNNMKSLTIDGYELTKVDNNNYTLTVSNDITSVNVNATAEDSKAKVTGTGVKDLQVGENNIEVIVTSESGVQNKINIKITRKDGYYLEDLDSVLKNTKLKDVDIIIGTDSKITTEQINKIKESKKNLKLNYYDQNKKLIYSWTIDGKEIKNSKEFTTAIAYTSENIKEIYKLSNYADGLHINFKHNGDLPSGTKIKLYVGDKFEDGSIVNLYRYNDINKKLDFIKDGIEVKEGYIEFDIDHCSEYFVTMSTISNITKENSSSINIFMILTIISIIIIIGLVVFIFIKLKHTNKEKISDSLEINNNSIDYSSTKSSEAIKLNNNTNPLSNLDNDNIKNNKLFEESTSSNSVNKSLGMDNVNNYNVTKSSEEIKPNNNINTFSRVNNINAYDNIKSSQESTPSNNVITSSEVNNYNVIKPSEEIKPNRNTNTFSRANNINNYNNIKSSQEGVISNNVNNYSQINNINYFNGLNNQKTDSQKDNNLY